MSGGIEDYAKRFARLRTNRNRKVWSGITADQAPHKPLLLLCVLDLLDSGEVPSNLIEITDDLTELFASYWERVLPLGILATSRCPFPPAGRRLLAIASEARGRPSRSADHVAGPAPGQGNRGPF